MSGTAASARRGRLPRIGVAVAVLLAVVGYGVMQYVSGEPGPRCAVVSGNGDGATYELSAEQAVNASTVAAVGTRRGMPERAVTIALATALQESGLHNVRHGDRDSLGLFQQRPSQGWGTPEQILNPEYASGKFYDKLLTIPNWQILPLTVAAQAAPGGDVRHPGPGAQEERGHGGAQDPALDPEGPEPDLTQGSSPSGRGGPGPR